MGYIFRPPAAVRCSSAMRACTLALQWSQALSLLQDATISTRVSPYILIKKRCFLEISLKNLGAPFHGWIPLSVDGMFGQTDMTIGRMVEQKSWFHVAGKCLKHGSTKIVGICI